MNTIKFDYKGLEKIISGGQCGVDQAALQAAKDVGLLTGGWAPKNWKTCVGPQEEFLKSFNLVEHSGGYKERTYANVRDSDGTIRLASNFSSPGEICTLDAINKFKKPYLDISLNIDPNNNREDEISKIIKFVLDNKISILNVAGNSDKTPRNGFGFHYHESFFILLKAFYIIKEKIKKCT
jgi:hypothetical protein